MRTDVWSLGDCENRTVRGYVVMDVLIDHFSTLNCLMQSRVGRCRQHRTRLGRCLLAKLEDSRSLPQR